MKKCPPGVICLENYAMFFMLICIFIIGYVIYTNNDKSVTVNNHPSEKIVIKDTERENPSWFSGWIPSWPYNNLPMFQDPLLNPYAPPLRDERYFIPGFNMRTRPHNIPINPGGIPINVSTNIGAVDTSYRQLGILAPSNGSSKDNIIPLMGRPLFTNRDKWQYYTISNTGSLNTKLPITFEGRSCTSENGCNNINNGDIVYVKGYNDKFRATIYESNLLQYIPIL